MKKVSFAYPRGVCFSNRILVFDSSLSRAERVFDIKKFLKQIFPIDEDVWVTTNIKNVISGKFCLAIEKLQKEHDWLMFPIVALRTTEVDGKEIVIAKWRNVPGEGSLSIPVGELKTINFLIPL